jgi:DeoR/GlpR family transcriptional regulator of sugar metabolism
MSRSVVPSAQPTVSRRDQLLEIVRQKGFASLPELTDALKVSESTVRRDLDQLEELGAAKRTHGGVFYTGGEPQLAHFVDRQNWQWAKKRRIGQRAAALVADGDTVLLDGGSTTYEVARCLVRRPIQVVTNSLPVANLFVAGANTDVVLLGGYIHGRTGVAIGPHTNEMLAKISVRRAIMSVAAINDEGFYNSNLLLVDTERAMLRAADEAIVVTDSTKFGHRSLAQVAPLAAIKRVVVDDELSPAWREKLAAAGIDVILAPAESAPVEKDKAKP